MVEQWMGHAPPYKGAYHNLRLEDMATEYEEYLHHLSITGPEKRTDRRIEDLHAKLGERDERIDNLEEQVQELQSKVESIDKFGRLLDSSGELEELKETIEESVERALLEKEE
ncbi:hypothetical protein AKJ65_03365 [candidate division MSBL1 archaeon SCGC-AAA259E19]|uniref:Uncharacterized protein n=1 Tax=candidate division MSBL1 archaeon SCGC-AAA259E19 TaxID=1698264 RepID=A0A133UKT4_9EURY|nr:hypothetical protein AKJ65_03365 [candidate division MSBL1 archaeon SCGC-AAA259E19]